MVFLEMSKGFMYLEFSSSIGYIYGVWISHRQEKLRDVKEEHVTIVLGISVQVQPGWRRTRSTISLNSSLSLYKPEQGHV